MIYRIGSIMKIISVIDKSWKETEKRFMTQLKQYANVQGSHRAGLLKMSKILTANILKLNK